MSDPDGAFTIRTSPHASLSVANCLAAFSTDSLPWSVQKTRAMTFGFAVDYQNPAGSHVGNVEDAQLTQ